MDVEEVKRLISQKTGVPASLLDGATPEENISKARALLKYRGRQEAQRPKTSAEVFEDWFQTWNGEEGPRDAAGMALDEIAEAVRLSQGGYPIIRDGGSIDPSRLPDPRPAREQFAEWFKEKTALDPFAAGDGWKEII